MREHRFPPRSRFLLGGALLGVLGLVGWLARPAAPESAPIGPAEIPPAPQDAAPEDAPAVAKGEREDRLPSSMVASKPQETSRTALNEARSLRGAVHDAAGRPITGVTVSLTFVDDALELAASPPHWAPPELLDARTLEVTTQPNGTFGFPATGSPSGDVGPVKWQVLWFTHPEFTAVSRVIASDQFDQQLDVTLPGFEHPVQARVTLDGAPKPSAVVIERAGGLAFASSDDEAQEAAPDARMAFLRRVTTDTLGDAPLYPTRFNLEVEASAPMPGGAPLVSAPWRGAPQPRIQLKLHSAFFVEGTILADPDTFQDGFAPVVTIWATRDGHSFQVASEGPLPTGQLEFGPFAVPSIEADAMEARLEAAGVGWVAAAFTPPAVGQTVQVSLEPPPAFAVQVNVTDLEGTPLPDAWVRVAWEHNTERVVQDALNMGGGHFAAASCPATTVRTRVGAEGFATMQLPDVAFPRDESNAWFSTELKPARMIRGVCTQDGKPVHDFTIEYWHRNVLASRGEKHILGSPDGGFSIPDGPPGELGLLALNNELERSDVFTLGSEDEGPVNLELRSTRFGVGVVKDSEGSPIASASVSLFIGQGGRAINPIGQPVKTQPDGSFRIPGIGVGENLIEVKAESFGRVLLNQYGPVEGPLDYGEIVLGKLHELTVHAKIPPGLEGEAPTTIGTNDPEVLLATPLGPNGSLVLPNVPAGQHLFKLDIPGVLTQYKARAIPVGGASTLEFNLTGGSRVTVELKGTGTPDEQIFVDIRHADSLGDTVDTCGFMTSEKTWTLRGIAPGLVKATGLGNATDTMAKGSLIVSEDGEEHLLTLTLSALRPLVRVVNSNGEPVAGADVMLYPDGGIGPDIFTRSDQDGICRFPELADNVRFATVYGPDRGIAQGLPFTAPPADSGPVDLLLDPSVELHIELQTDGAPAAGVAAQLSETHRKLWIGTQATSNAQGQISVAKLAPGPYELHVWGEGIWPMALHVTAPQATPKPIAVWPTANLSLRVIDAEGLAVPQTQVELTHQALGEGPGTWLAQGKIQSSSPNLTTDAQGKLTLAGLPAGSYTWTIDGIDGTLETHNASSPIVIVLP